MSIDAQALRNSADRDWFEEWFKKEYHPNKTGPYINDQMFFAIQAACAPLLDELEAAEKRIAELGGHLKSAHAFIENTEAFGYEAASGILKCGDSEWNVDASKESLTAAGITVKGDSE